MDYHKHSRYIKISESPYQYSTAMDANSAKDLKEAHAMRAQAKEMVKKKAHDLHAVIPHKLVKHVVNMPQAFIAPNSKDVMKMTHAPLIF